LAYGRAASATWVLGLPGGLAMLHGKTRRGGLVFDVVDLVKDAIILPQAFISAMTSRRPTVPAVKFQTAAMKKPCRGLIRQSLRPNF
jgi:CRISPR-associated endonuclease Cas1 subtype I-F